MRNPTSSRESSAGSSADLQGARQGCIELGRQAEGIAELVVPLLRQASQELGRLEAQRAQAALPKLAERIEEQGQHVKRLERASRGLKELISAIGGLGEQLQGALARRDEELRELEAIAREEKRLWLQELNTLREQVRGQERPAATAPAPQEESQRLRAERDRLSQRVAELEKGLAVREQTLVAKEQTIEDLRRMIVLLTAGTATATPAPGPKQRLPAPLNVVPLAPPVPTPKPPPEETMFGNSTMRLADSLLETLSSEATPPPVAEAPGSKAPSMEIMLGPLDELEAAPPSLPPPVPTMTPVPRVPPVAPMTAMPRASARSTPPAPARTPAPVPAPPRPPERPGTLVISEDMFNEMLIEESALGGSGRK